MPGFVERMTSDLCRIDYFNDDEFSHWVFFTGFVMSTSRSYSFKTFFPTGRGITNTDFALLALNALFLGAGVFANLGFETIGLDLYVVALLAFICLSSVAMQQQPMFVYYTIAYVLGLAGSVVARLLR